MSNITLKAFKLHRILVDKAVQNWIFFIFFAIENWCDMAHVYTATFLCFQNKLAHPACLLGTVLGIIMLKQFYNIRKASAGMGQNSAKNAAAKNAADSLATQRVPDLCSNPV